MANIIIVFCVFLCIKVVANHSNASDTKNSKDFFGLTDAELLTAATNFKFDETTPKGINFLMFKKGDETNPITLDNDNLNAVLNISYFYKIIIHGWTHSGTEKWIRKMAAALHEIGDFNIIAVDWGQIAAKNYVLAAVATRSVGNFVGDFILSLNTSLENVHVIGHSLGAQVSGFVGKRLGYRKLGRISGLDPAAPLFEYPIPFVSSWRLTASDAKFVDVMHVQLFWRGVVAPCGTIDFYVNNGGPQPDCSGKNTSKYSQYFVNCVELRGSIFG